MFRKINRHINLFSFQLLLNSMKKYPDQVGLKKSSNDFDISDDSQLLFQFRKKKHGESLEISKSLEIFLNSLGQDIYFMELSRSWNENKLMLVYLFMPYLRLPLLVLHLPICTRNHRLAL